MKEAIRVLAFFALALGASVTHASQYSVLNNINCGGSQATCNQFSTSLNGGARCTCTANCSSAYCAQGNVAATATVTWGTYAQMPPCSAPVDGSATGGTQIGPSSGLVSSVFAAATAVTIYSTTTIQFVDDCCAGLIVAKPALIVYPC